MNYQFPYITNISDVLPAIEGRDEFVVAEKEGYTVINYNVMMAETFDCNIRRECRGIIFDSATGEILRRPFHKFFNVNEREETQDHVIDLSRDHRVLEKLDGSMIAPFIVNGQMIWGTKMGATDVAKPVEEFVSRKQRIVLDYFDDQLVLTAIRNLNTGVYAAHGFMEAIGRAYAVPVVNAYGPRTDMKAFIEYVRQKEDIEGYVVRFADGHMLKLKCDWYLQIHRAKEAILQDRNIVELILDNKLDDVKAHLPAEERFELSRFEHLFSIEMYGQAQFISNMLEHIREENIDRKKFALEIAPSFNQYTRAAIFTCWDFTDDAKILDVVRNTIRNNLTKTVKYEAIREFWFNGVTYNA
jgi:RNA ligase